MPTALLTLLLTLAATAASDPAKRLRVWVQRVERTSDPVRAEEWARLDEILVELDARAPESAEERREEDLALIDLAVVERRERLRAPPPAPGFTFGAPPAPSRRAARRLDRRLRLDRDGRMAAWLANEVLAPGQRELERRYVAAELLAARYAPATLDALKRAARDEDRELARLAQLALAGWPEAVVHRFFLDELERGGAFLKALRRHLELAHESLGPPGLEALRAAVARLYFSTDWRDAARADDLVRWLDTPRAVPLLIEALATWVRRAEEGEGSRRIEHELVAHLRRLSGRSIGPHPERWNRWWQAVRSGQLELPEDDEGGGDSYSSAVFFGLRPVTDKVAFVVDRSGSMDGVFGTGARSRYEEAVDQLVRFLEASGPRTSFDIVLFNDGTRRYRSRPQPASPSNLEHARRWLEAKGPEGGTRLREGVETVLEWRRRGGFDPTELAVDTIVVLCDGATEEGPRWVDAEWLRLVGEVGQIVFHCVQIGGGGDGTLEALAEGTGGAFVRVQR